MILSRVSQDSPEFLTEVLVAALESRSDWRGHFAIVEVGRIRLRQLPGKGSEGAA